ncbi:MAG: hypothetical protein K9I74_07160 [Bacteroidales bacterium]|nr:hypothetical protein [Bacteroidales bacterium]
MRINRQIIKTILLALVLAFLTFKIHAQGKGTAPPPPPGGSSGSQNTENNSNGSAPIGSGIIILLSLGAAYGGKKVYDYRRKLKNEMEE